MLYHYLTSPINWPQLPPALPSCEPFLHKCLFFGVQLGGCQLFVQQDDAFGKERVAVGPQEVIVSLLWFLDVVPSSSRQPARDDKKDGHVSDVVLR